MNVTVEARASREPIHRAMLRFPIDRRGAIAGLILAVVVIAASFVFANVLWRGEQVAVGGLLRMSGTPFETAQPATGVLGGALRGGTRFTVPGDPSRIPEGAAVAGIVAFALASVVAIRSRLVPVPAKVLWLLFATIGGVTLWYTGFASGVPSHPVRSMSIGFQRGGLLTVVVAVVLFAFEVFPVPGPFRVKAGWLAALLMFSIGWSVVRMAFVLATVSQVGPWTFLYLHYLAGPVVDFLTIVAFYSFATYGLARRLGDRGAR